MKEIQGHRLSESVYTNIQFFSLALFISNVSSRVFVRLQSTGEFLLA